jgi:uncharacterized protein YuzE
MKTTKYFDATRQRPDRSMIDLAWIEFVAAHPQAERAQDDGRIRRWAPMGADRRVRRALAESRASRGRRNRPQRILRPEFDTMKIRYFEDTDTLLIELKTGTVAQTRDLDENTLLDLDAQGQVLAITLEHATGRAELSSFSFDRVAA